MDSRSKNDGLWALQVVNVNVRQKKIFHFWARSTPHIAPMKDSYLYINILPGRYWASTNSIPSTEAGLRDSSQKNQLVFGAKGQQLRDGPETGSEREWYQRLLPLDLPRGAWDSNIVSAEYGPFFFPPLAAVALRQRAAQTTSRQQKLPLFNRNCSWSFGAQLKQSHSPIFLSCADTHQK